MEQSILTSVKKTLGLPADHTEFDLDILLHTNTALATLTQIGIGPSAGFEIEDADTTWVDLLGADPKLNGAKTYVYLRVRLLFDPPQTSHAMSAYKEQLQELEWRLNVAREAREWDDPRLEEAVDETIYDGGGA